MTALGKKLQLKTGHQLMLRKAPKGVAQALEKEGYMLVRPDEVPQSRNTAVVVFVESAAELEQLVLPVLVSLAPLAILWVAYPKKSSGVKTDLTRNNGWQVMAANNYEAVRQVAINEVWSALRFRKQSERKVASTYGKDMPGIDRKAKTVVVPPDLEEALQAAELLATFESLAFTHRKECVVAVLEAKRPETRARRVANTVERMVQLAAK